MATGTDLPGNPGEISVSETPVAAADAVPAPAEPAVQPWSFRNRMLLSARELRKLRQHQEEFAAALAARLSVLLRLEFSVTLAELLTLSFQEAAGAWQNPSHLTLFKADPLRGVGILEIPPQLGASLVERLMGGSGQAPDGARDLSEIELALLDQAVQMIIGEWCAHWSRLKDVKPAVLGHESNGRFIQTATPETSMLVVRMGIRLNDFNGSLQICFPYSALEGLIRQLCQTPEVMAAQPPPAPAAPPLRWNPNLDEVRLPVSVGWHGVELAARELMNLKVGDVLQLDPKSAQTVQVRLGGILRFNARLGALAGDWAVELVEKFTANPT